MNPIALYIAIGTSVAAVTGAVIFSDELGFGTKDPAVSAPIAELKPSAQEPAKPEASKEETEVASLPDSSVQTDATQEEATATLEVHKSIPPSFDVVRVEPNGQTLVAGKAEPGAKVALYNGDTLISEVIADGNGDFVMILEEALEAGTSDLSLAALSKEGEEPVRSKSNVTVALPEDGSGELLVMETVAGEASKIIAKLDPPKPVVEESAKVEETPGTAVETEVAKVEEPKVEPQAEEVAQAPVEPAKPVEPKETAVVAEPEAEKEPVVKQEEVAVTKVEEPVAEVPVVAPSVEEAVETKQQDPVSKPQITLSLSIEAVEIEKDTLFVAGAAEPAGSAVRLYVNNKPISDGRSGDTGRFLFDGSVTLDAGDHVARVDLLDPASGKVAKRAEVKFSKIAGVEALQVSLKGGTIDAQKGGVGVSATSGDLETKKVIIRRGDNLWTIARRVYGAGFRYSTIYDNNDDQIKDPHWIYPGQVFELPRGEADWETDFEAAESPSEEDRAADASAATAQ